MRPSAPLGPASLRPRMTKPPPFGKDPDPPPGGETFGKWFQEAMGGVGGGTISDFYLDEEDDVWDDEDDDWIPMSAEEAGPPARGAELLVCDSPRELMDRVLDDSDPLGLWNRVEAHLEEEAILMDIHRVCGRAGAHIAMVAVRDFYRGFPPLDEWLIARINDGIKDLVDEDWAAIHRSEPIDPENNPFAFMTDAARIDPLHARIVTRKFNQLPPKVRRPVYAVLVKNQPMDKVADDFGFPLDEFKSMVADVLSGILGDPAEDLLRRLEEELG